MTTAPGPPHRLLERLAGEAHLWLTPLPESRLEPRLAAEWRALLAPEEAAANDRIRVASGRRQHLAARALVRTTLSRYAAVDPRRWRFRVSGAGRPEIGEPGGLPPLRFNLSHTRGLVACVVTLGLDAGVDAEHRRREVRDPLALAEHSFAPAEQRALRRLEGEARRRHFRDLWTLKEAYVKARGAGFLSLPARRFAWEIAGDTLELTLDPDLGDTAADWQAALLAAGDSHRLAVAIRRGRRPDLALALWEVTPLAGAPRPLAPEPLARTPAAASAAPAAVPAAEAADR